MNDRLPWPLVAIVAAVGGAALFGVQKSGPDATPVGKVAPPAAKDMTATRPTEETDETPDPLNVVRQFFQYEKDPKKGTPGVGYRVWPAADGWHVRPEPGTTESQGQFDVGRLPAVNFEFLVATVPDPVDSKFALEFDTTVEAIQRAFQARGYILHTSWLPWALKSTGKPAQEFTHRSYPGVLLFRKNLTEVEAGGPTKSALCVVCLVGENPISGIQKAALTGALAAHRRLADAARRAGQAIDPPPDGPIPVVGPYYSGSQSVLRNTLWAWQDRYGVRDVSPQFRIISGSATAVQPEVFFRGSGLGPYRAAGVAAGFVGGHPLAAAAAAPLAGRLAGPGITFQATVVPNELVLNAVLDYMGRGPGGRVLGRAGYDSRPGPAGPTDQPVSAADRRENDRRDRWAAGVAGLGKIAFLRESNTGYGGRQERQRKPDGEQPGGVTVARPDVLDLPFPISVSQIKVDLDKLTAGTKGTVPEIQPEVLALKLPVKDATQVDGVPLYDRESSVAVAADNLRDILATIDREGVRYVGIVASDNRDVVFLNKLLKQHCPRVRVFTTEPSVVLSLPAESYHMRGMVIGSTYSLYEPNQGWTNPGLRRRLPFASQSAVGYYNAVLAQFGERDKMIEYRAPRLRGEDPLTARPPIWVSVIGQNGDLIPVKMYPDYADEVPGPTPGMPAAYVYPGDSRLEFGRADPAAAADPAAETLDRATRADYGMPPAPALTLLVLAAMAVAGAVAYAAWWPGRGWTEYLFPPGPAPGRDNDPGSGVVRFMRWVCRVSLLLFLIPLLFVTAAGWEYSGVWAAGNGWQVAVFGLVVAAVLAAAVYADPFPAWVVPAGFVAWVATVLLFRGPGLQWVFLLAAGSVTVAAVGSAVLGMWATGSPAARWVAVAWAGLLGAAAYWRFGGWDHWDRFFWLVRVADLSSGLSPILPTLLLAGAVFVIGAFHLRQATIGRDYCVPCPFLRAGESDVPDDWRKDVVAEHNALADQFGSGWGWLRRGGRKPAVYVLCVPLFLFAAWFCASFHRTAEGRVWDVLIRALFWSAGAAVAFTLARFLTLWAGLNQVLEEIGKVRMARAFERLPDKVPRLFHGMLYSGRPHVSHWGVALQFLLPEERKRVAAVCKAKLVGHPALAALFGGEKQAGGHPPPGDTVCDRAALAACLAAAAGDCLRNDLPKLWVGYPVNDAYGRNEPPAGGGEAAAAEWEDRAGGFVATVVVIYFSHFFVQLRQLAVALTISSPLLLMAAASYPFQPERPLIYALIGLLLAVVAGILYVLYDINRNELVSRITKTTPNKFTPDRNFLSSVGMYVLPILGVVAAHLLGVFRIIFEPILGSLR